MSKKKPLSKILLRKRKKNESAFKHLMGLLHLWLGLLSSIVIFVLCLSGSIYAFKNQIIDLYNYDKIFVSASAQTKMKPDEVATIFNKEGKQVTALAMPVGNRSWMVSYNEGLANSSTFINPYTGQKLGSADAGLNSFFEVILDLHRNLMLGNVGRQIGGISVLMFLVLLTSGFVLWLPKKLKYLKQGLTIKLKSKFFRLNHDLHNVLGFYAIPLLFFIAVTGIYVTYPWVKNAVIISLGGQSIQNTLANENDDTFANLMGDMMDRQQEKKEETVKTISLNDILKTANQHLNYEGNTIIELPNEENPRYTVRKVNAQHWYSLQLPDEITFDKAGTFKTKEIFLDKPLDKQFTSLAKPLHTGEIMGLPSIILYFIVTLIGCMLPVTGFIIWWHRVSK